MQSTNGHIMDPSFVNDPSSETGGSRCKTRCPSAAVVKRDLSHTVVNNAWRRPKVVRLVFKLQGGQQWGEVWQGGWGVQTLPDWPQLCPILRGKWRTRVTPPLKTIPCSNVRKWMLFNNEEVISNIRELPFPSIHNTSYPSVPLFRHLCLLMPCYKTCYGHLLTLYK